MSQTYWRIWCTTESLWTYGYSLSSPTTCFTNAGHTVNSGSVQDIIDGVQTQHGSVTFDGTVDATAIGTGTIVIPSGGISVVGQIQSSGVLTIGNTTASTAIGNGAIVCSGGLSLSGNSFASGVISLTNTTNAVSTSTGALILSGGLAASGAVYLGNALTVTGFTTHSGIVLVSNTTVSSSISTGALQVGGGLGVSGSTYIGGSLTVTGSLSYLTSTLTGTTDSTSVGTGTLIVNGGVSIAKNTYHAGIINVTNTTVTSSITTGATVISGGLGVKNIYTGGFTCSTPGSAGTTITIDAQHNQTNGAVIQFINSASTGDYRIWSDGGDCQWLGGGSRNMQFGAYHGVVISGGRNSTTIIPQLAGTGTVYNCLIDNINNSIGLIVQGVSGQSADLQQWQNSTGTVLTNVDYSGNIDINTSTASTSTTTGALTVNGGTGITGNVYLGGNTSSTSGGWSYHMLAKTTTYTVLATDNYIACDTSSASFTVTLPTNSGIAGQMYVISKITTDSNYVTVTAQSGETIGPTNRTVLLPFGFSSITVVSNGSTVWQLMSFTELIRNNPSSFVYPYGGVYGAGLLGSVTISTNTSLAANSYYVNLTINSGIVLNTNGWQVFVQNTLTFVSGTSAISCNGGNASNGTAGVSGGTYADLITGTYSTYLGGGRLGAAGRSTTGTGTASTGYSTNNSSCAGQGGNGGSTSGNSAGTAGTSTQVPAINGGVSSCDILPNAMGRGLVGFYNIAYNGATGGASGGLTAGLGTGLLSGAGGGGAGVVVVVARTISAPSGGIIQAIGGNGGNATATTLSTASIGGGGTGGGGIVSIVTSTPFNTLSLTLSVAAGSTPGTGLGTGGNSGAVGTAGRIIINQV